MRKIKKDINLNVKIKRDASNTVLKESSPDPKPSHDIARNEYMLNLINGWIVNADSKISISTGILSIIFGVFFFIAENYLDAPTCKDALVVHILFWISIALIAISVGFFIVSFVFYLIALSPKFTSNYRQKQFSIFFEEIKTFDKVEDFIESANEATLKDYNNEILSEAYYNSLVCSKKMHNFKRGLWFGFYAIALIVVSVVLLIISGLF